MVMEYPIGAIHKSVPTEHMHPKRVTCGINRHLVSVTHSFYGMSWTA